MGKKKLAKITPEESVTAIRNVEEFFQEYGFEISSIKGEELMKPNIDWEVSDKQHMVAEDFMIHTGQLKIVAEISFGLSKCRVSTVYEPGKGYFKLWTVSEAINFQEGLQETIVDGWKKGSDGLLLPMRELLNTVKKFAIHG